MGAEFSDGYFVSDVLLWPAGAVYIPPYPPGKSKSLTNPFKCAILLKDTKKTKKVQALRRR